MIPARDHDPIYFASKSLRCGKYATHMPVLSSLCPLLISPPSTKVCHSFAVPKRGEAPSHLGTDAAPCHKKHTSVMCACSQLIRVPWLTSYLLTTLQVFGQRTEKPRTASATSSVCSRRQHAYLHLDKSSVHKTSDFLHCTPCLTSFPEQCLQASPHQLLIYHVEGLHYQTPLP